MTTQWHWNKALLLSVGCGIGLAIIFAGPAMGAESSEDSGFKWWWNDEEEAESSEDDTPWMITSPFANVTWPEIKMPRISLLPPWRDNPEEPTATWTTPFSRAREATRGAIDRTRTAWNSAVERMKFALPGGDEPEPPQVAAAEVEPSLWQRMFGRNEPEPGPNSVGDLMAKESDRDAPRIRR